jgi:hypothetical protein
MFLDFLFGALKELAHPAMVLFFYGTGKLVQGSRITLIKYGKENWGR